MVTHPAKLEVIKLISCSTQLSMKISSAHRKYNIKNKAFDGFQNHSRCIYHPNKCLNVNNSWHFNIYEHDNFHNQRS